VVSEIMLGVTSLLLFGTISAIVLYYRRIRIVNQEYERARGIINDVVVGVDRQFSRQKDRVLFFARKIEDVLLENKKVTEKVEEYEGRLSDLTKVVVDVPQFEKKFSGQIEEMRSEVVELKEGQEKVFKKLVEIERFKKEHKLPEMKIEAAIPIKKEKALEPLTETELMVLETIGKEGEKTAPEIRDRIGLTREHTARLMKKLYKDGYLERDTHKMPYVYRLKEEMEKILKKRETNIS
jgi:DNA-binding MarR family transcriptional regulator